MKSFDYMSDPSVMYKHLFWISNLLYTSLKINYSEQNHIEKY